MAVPEKITEFLRGKGASFEEVAHDEAFTSVEESQSLGVEVGEVAKVIVVKLEGGYALVALPASEKTNMRGFRKIIGDKHARFASEEEMERDYPDYALGSVPPFGELVGAPLYIDTHLAEHDTVVFAAGTHTDSIKMRVEDLKNLGPHEVIEACRQPKEEA
jgi:Ala-tRNA(Pro) deacylase